MRSSHGFAVSVEPLVTHRVDVWCRTVSSADEGWVFSELGMLSPDERARISIFRRPEDRLSFVVGRVVLRRLLAAYARVDASELIIHAPSGTKPAVIAPDRAAPIEFNLSHTDGLLVWAFGLGRSVGVDAESIPRMKTLDPPPADFFSAAERQAIAAVPPEERQLRLSQHWTLKESLVKALGTGLTYDLTQCSFDVSADGGVHFQNTGSGEAASWEFRILRPTPLHTAALCVKRAPQEPLDIRVLWDLP